MTDKSELKKVYELILNEMLGAWVYLNAYTELFLHSDPRRKKLIDLNAPGFFNIVKASFAECLLIKIARLMDPAKTGSNENMTFNTLFLLDDIDETLKDSFYAINNEWESGKYNPIREYRRKLSAHNDYKVIQEKPSDVLTRLTNQEFSLINELFHELWQVLTKVHLEINNSSLLEPQYENLDSLPTTIFRSLASSLFLTELIQRENSDVNSKIFCDLSNFEYDDVGRETPIRLIDH